MIHAKNALIAATATWPMAYDPTRRMTSSARETVRGRRLAGTSGVGRLLDGRERGEEVEGEDEDGQSR